MTKAGVVIFALFAFAWFVLAGINGAPIGWVALLAAAAVSGGLVLAAIRADRSPDALTDAQRRRFGRIFIWASVGEGIGILILINVLDWFGLPDRHLAGVAFAVGLHFVPIGLVTAPRMYLPLALAFLALGIVGLTVSPAALATLLVACGAGVVLWTAAALSLPALGRSRTT